MVEVAALIVVGYIAVADHIVDIAERKDIAEEAQQGKTADIAGEQMDIVDLVIPAGEDSSVLYRLANYRTPGYTTR